MTTHKENIYLPDREFVEQAHIQSRAEYERMWKQSIDDPETFWGYIAKDFHWFKPWTQVYRGDASIGDNEWFVGGKTNICYKSGAFFMRVTKVATIMNYLSQSYLYHYISHTY